MKPENMGYEAASGRWYVIDVESACRVPEGVTWIACGTSFKHTPPYAAPEVVAGTGCRVALDTDLYSVGVIMRKAAEVCECECGCMCVCAVCCVLCACA